MPGTVVHFDIPADNPEKLARFYEDLLGWKFQRFEQMDYWMIMTRDGENAPGADGGMSRRSEMASSPINYYGVESIDEALDKLTKIGGTVKAPKMAIPNIGWMAHCVDPDGNLFGLFQTDTKAA